ncbi:unnamed protein product [Durusdinium trenchii]|uniref:Uncharacterized protein n=1 Tax=Durusdinium trenchii TaxID=1381693 RepID=A0ABP0JE59_9DINO
MRKGAESPCWSMASSDDESSTWTRPRGRGGSSDSGSADERQAVPDGAVIVQHTVSAEASAVVKSQGAKGSEAAAAPLEKKKKPNRPSKKKREKFKARTAAEKSSAGAVRSVALACAKASSSGRRGASVRAAAAAVASTSSAPRKASAGARGGKGSGSRSSASGSDCEALEGPVTVTSQPGRKVQKVRLTMNFS